MSSTGGKKYGILTLVWMLVFGLLFSATIVVLGMIDNVSAIITVAIGLAVGIASIATIIRINDDTIIISSAIPFIAKKVVISIDNIEKLEIEPGIYSGNTSYKFYLKGNQQVETYGKLLKIERKRLIANFKSRGVNVVLNTFP
ncbi:MAG: hypothetical protein K8F30_15105 [Taibaiella sp.]|nr:hypothetical protein [Taibaiella sp.]